MDDEIKKEDPIVNENSVKGILEYKPITTVKPTVVDDRSDSYLDSITIDRIKKIRTEVDKNRISYPWEIEIPEYIAPKKQEENKPYEKKVYTVPLASIIRKRANRVKVGTTYIITSSDGGGQEAPQNVDNSNYRTAGNFTQKTPSGTVTTQGHLFGWKYKVLPGTENIKNIDKRLQKVQSRIIPGYKNGYIPKSFLAPIQTTNKSISGKVYLHYEAAGAYQKMFEAAKKDGIGIYISGLLSAYRDYDGQVKLRRLHGSSTTATPGTSNHGWGKAIDVSGKVDNYKAQKWINLNGDRFGFYWGDAKNEEWHFVYVW
jgi:LAS superfamily LD-carboxypeptidase LdcB